ncbi:hypothetical protein [Hymenobacter edaphi]|uniref:Uncharacterized protein n=1 Tax=Hymenobacter edaphi TaxID=2211146 RepID=A0A328BKZ9_9BACT|nr:hypothetical protein [Hymenobacter edaphi]RAK67111.1 hypothetical protein DLM85_13005 [Hymenobacter edaphi]
MNQPNNPQVLQLAHEDLAQLANVGNGSISFGPLTLSWNFTLDPLAFNASATILGVSIGQVTLDAQHPTMTIGGHVSKFTAEITLTLDIPSKTVSYHIVVQVPIIGTIIDKSGSIHL